MEPLFVGLEGRLLKSIKELKFNKIILIQKFNNLLPKDGSQNGWEDDGKGQQNLYSIKRNAQIYELKTRSLES